MSTFQQIGGAFFQQTPQGLSAVNDPNTLNQLRSGQLQFTEGSFGGQEFSSQVATPSLVPQIQDQNLQEALPQPTAPSIMQDFTTSIAQTLDRERKALESRIQADLERARKEREEAQRRFDEQTTKVRDVIDQDVQPLLQPFREELEKAERERLKVEENFFANQELVGELDSLLTQIQADVRATREVTGLASIREPRINKVAEDAMARVGVIEAVMAARNNQIGTALTLIDRSVNAINADRRDRLSFFETILNFESQKRDEAGQELLNLDKEIKDTMNQEVSLMERDLLRAEENADYIKSLMRDPESALFMARAGVTLNDSPEEVNRKIAEQSKIQEVESFKNNMREKGFEFVPFPQGRTNVQMFTVGGKELAFKPTEGGVGFTTTQRFKLEQAGLANAPRQQQLDFLFGDVDEDMGGGMLSVWNQAADEGVTVVAAAQRLIDDGFSPGEVRAFLSQNTNFTAGDRNEIMKEVTEGRLSVPVETVAESLVAGEFTPRLLRSRSGELKIAKNKALERFKLMNVGSRVRIGGEVVTITETLKQNLIDTINAIDDADKIKRLSDQL